ncbi:holin [Caulobacter phage CcrColossus]|uniref:Putative holin protein n=1 Tax=Caulobacter phage CcrColossus TaxID=1211640 RepID=K4JUJ0_9CAUD|nr:holin [Caulobacter phage CcrColossus]AFU88005.1 putative holin protein [Caulobacter phage CcrColossus]
MQMPAMPNMAQAQGYFQRFSGWVGSTVKTLCDRPDHLQRLAIIGAGMVVQLTMWAVILIVWLGYDRTPELQSQSLNFMGWALMGSMALWGLVVVTLLGTIKGLSIAGPGGFGINLLTTADDPDVDPSTPRGHDHGGWRGGGGGGPPPDGGKQIQVTD